MNQPDGAARPREALETVTRDAHELDERQLQEVTDFQLATSGGFYDELAEADGQQAYRQIAADQRLRFTMVYDRSAAAPSRHAAAPVHTYASFPGTLNAGGAQPVALHKITAVTVSPTHRRRGILRAQMRADLAYAAGAGFAVAGLTASEATIYGRFGFDVATRQTRFTLKCAQGLELRNELPGHVVDVEPERFAEQFHDLARRAEAATFGTVEATLFDEGHALGRWDGFETLAKPKQLRFAAVLDEHGTAQGLVTYKFAGWDKEPGRMVVHQLIATGQAARIKLLQHVANHDLIEEVHARGPVNDPLRLLLADERRYTVRSTDDMLWLRILDLPAAFAARGYANSGRVVLDVRDDLGLVEGTYLIEVREGRAAIGRLSGAVAAPLGCPVVQLTARDAAVLYLGTANLNQLLQLGRARSLGTEPLGSASRLFDGPGEPYTLYGF